MTRRKKSLLMITQFHRQYFVCVTHWKHDQNAEDWVRLSKAQDQGLEFWQTKSFAIVTYAMEIALIV